MALSDVPLDTLCAQRDALMTLISQRIAGGAVISYSIAGRDLTYESLEVLRKLLKDINDEIKIRTSSNAGMPFTYVVPGRSR